MVYKVILAVDELASKDPGFVDGHYTTIAQRKNEAYRVITNSTDEVFLTSLYDWYLENGWSERLLVTNTPFVATYLQRKSTEDTFHADLLWKYYGQSGRYYDAAAVQFQLAQSEFDLPLSRRVEYLGQARANASAFTPDVSRSARQRLTQEISTLMDVANVQDELLQRLREDPRVSDHQKDAVEALDGRVLDLSTVSIPYDGKFSLFYRHRSDIRCSCTTNMQTLAGITILACRLCMLPITATRLISSRHGSC